MKITWGTGIAIFFVIFVIALVSVVMKARKVDHSLVAENYYEHDLSYQEHYDKLKNVKIDSAYVGIQIHRNTRKLVLQFPESDGIISGELLFFKPNNKSLDFEKPIITDSLHRQTVDISELAAGLWKIKVDWSNGQKSYFQEKRIQI